MEVKTVTAELKAVDGEQGLIEGYVSTYGNVDLNSDKVMPGAFAKTLQETVPRVLWQHDRSASIGVHVSHEDRAKGLFVHARLPINKGIAAVDSAFASIQEGLVDSMSIGYSVIKSDWEGDPYMDDSVHILRELKLFEYSLVTMPANPKAVITRVKCAADVNALLDTLAEAGELPDAVRLNMTTLESAAVALASLVQNCKSAREALLNTGAAEPEPSPVDTPGESALSNELTLALTHIAQTLRS